MPVIKMYYLYWSPLEAWNTWHEPDLTTSDQVPMLFNAEATMSVVLHREIYYYNVHSIPVEKVGSSTALLKAHSWSSVNCLDHFHLMFDKQPDFTGAHQASTMIAFNVMARQGLCEKS